MPDVSLPGVSNPAAVAAAAANAQYNYYNSAAGKAAMDAANEAAKYARFNNPNPLAGINPLVLANMSQSEIASRYGSDVRDAVSDYFQSNPSARFQGIAAQYGEQQQNTVGSSATYRQPTAVGSGSNPFNPNSAAGISWEVARTGGTVNPFTGAMGAAEGYKGPVNLPVNPLTGGVDYGMSTVPVPVKTSGLPTFVSSSGFSAKDTITTYVPFGNFVQTQLFNTKDIIDYNTGEIGIYQPEYYAGKLIGFGLTSSGGRNALQSGTFTFNLPETPYVTTQLGAGKYSLPSGAGLSRLGAEAYGGFVQSLDNRVLAKDTPFSTYANQYNFANLVNPQGPNMSKAAAPGINLPWIISESSPALQYTGGKVISTGPPTAISPSELSAINLMLGTFYKLGLPQPQGVNQTASSMPTPFVSYTTPSKVSGNVLDGVSTWLKSAPIFGSIYEAGSKYPEGSAIVAKISTGLPAVSFLPPFTVVNMFTSPTFLKDVATTRTSIESGDLGATYNAVNMALAPLTIDPLGIGRSVKEAPAIQGYGAVGDVGNFLKGAYGYMATHPLDIAISYELGAATSYGIGTAKLAASTAAESSIPGISTAGRALISPVVADLAKLTGVAIGGAFVYQTGKSILSQPTYEMKGEVAGSALNQMVGFGAGFSSVPEPTSIPGVTGTGTRISNFIGSVSPITYSVVEGEGGQTLRVLSVRTPQWNDWDLRAMDAARTYILDTFPQQVYDVLSYRPVFNMGGLANADLKALDAARTYMLDVLPGKMYEATQKPYEVAGRAISAIDRATLEASRSNLDLRMFDQARTFMLDVAPGKMYEATTVPYAIAGQALSAADRLSYKITGYTGDLQKADVVRTYMLDVLPGKMYEATQKPYEIAGRVIGAADRMSLAATRYTGDLQAFDAARTYVLDVLPEQIYNVLSYRPSGPSIDLSRYRNLDLKALDAARTFVLDTIPEKMPVMPDVSYYRGTSEPGLYSIGVLSQPGKITAFRGFPGEMLSQQFGDITGFGDLFKFTPAPIPQYAPAYEIREFTTGRLAMTPLEKVQFRAATELQAAFSSNPSAMRDIATMTLATRFIEPTVKPAEPDIVSLSRAGDYASEIRSTLMEDIHSMMGSATVKGQYTEEIANESGIRIGKDVDALVRDVDKSIASLSDKLQISPTQADALGILDLHPFTTYKNYPLAGAPQNLIVKPEDITEDELTAFEKLIGDPYGNFRLAMPRGPSEIVVANKDYPGQLTYEKVGVQVGRKASGASLGVFAPEAKGYRFEKDFYDFVTTYDAQKATAMEAGQSKLSFASSDRARADLLKQKFTYGTEKGGSENQKFITRTGQEIYDQYFADVQSGKIESGPVRLVLNVEPVSAGIIPEATGVTLRSSLVQPFTQIPSFETSLFTGSPERFTLTKSPISGYNEIVSPLIISDRVDSGISIVPSVISSVSLGGIPSTPAGEFMESISTGRSNEPIVRSLVVSPSTPSLPESRFAASVVPSPGNASPSISDLNRVSEVSPSIEGSFLTSYFSSIYGSGSPSPSIVPSPSISPSLSPSPSPVPSPSPSLFESSWGSYDWSLILSPSVIPSPSPDQYYHKKKRKPQPSVVFREILPIITPVEELGGFKNGKAFFRAIGNQRILEVKPQQRDWLHYVDVDVDVRELQQKDTDERVSDFAGMNFYRTATKQEKAKTGKPILTYTPTQQELSMAKMVGIGSSKKPSNKGRKNSLWFL